MSTTNCHAYNVFVSGAGLMIASNTWLSGLDELKGEDKDWLKKALLDSIEPITSLSGLAQDTASVNKAAWRDLQPVLEAKYGPVQYINCAEHVSQLILQDLAKAISWLKDLCATIRPRFGHESATVRPRFGQGSAIRG